MCGISGFIGKTNDAVDHVLPMLIELEGRGPHSAGVSVVQSGGHIEPQNRLGTATHLAERIDLTKFRGNAAIGHDRYATAGSLADAQPLKGEIDGQEIALCVNGDTVNICGMHVADYRRTGRRVVYRARSDTETLFRLVAESEGDDLVDRLEAAFQKVEGAWSLLALIGDGRIVAMRDPWGFRPLWIGQSEQGIAFASEDSALPSDFRAQREVAPGEMICVGTDLNVRSWIYRPAAKRLYRCAFEDVYFKKPGSRGVYGFRTACGAATADEMIRLGKVPAGLDGVVPVMDSGRDAGIALAFRLGLPVIFGINRTRLRMGARAFLGHSPYERLKLAAQKHAPNREALRGRSVLLVEDSIVRGDTLMQLIQMVREAGAAAVHVAVVSPRITGPCYYGIATPDRWKLIASSKSFDQTCQHIGADSLYHLSIEGFQANYHHLSIAGFRERLAARSDVCDACMTDDYPPFVPPSHTQLCR